MMVGSTFLSLLDTLEIILYNDPTRENDQYCSSLIRSLTLGTKAMNKVL